MQVFISDEVRAPIPQKQEVLIQPGFEGYSINRSSNMLRANRVRSVFDGFRNFSNEASKSQINSQKKSKLFQVLILQKIIAKDRQEKAKNEH